MDKYNKLCRNLKRRIDIDCENTLTKDYTYCNLIHIFYEDCVKFRNQKMHKMTLESSNSNIIKDT
jgi:hypothetical protein